MTERVLNMLMFILSACVSIGFLIFGVSEENIVKIVCSLLWMFGSGVWFSKWLVELAVGSM